MGSFLLGSLRQVLANLRSRAQTLETAVPKSCKKVCHTNVQTTHVETTHWGSGHPWNIIKCNVKRARPALSTSPPLANGKHWQWCWNVMEGPVGNCFQTQWRGIWCLPKMYEAPFRDAEKPLLTKLVLHSERMFRFNEWTPLASAALLDCAWWLRPVKPHKLKWNYRAATNDCHFNFGGKQAKVKVV